MKPGIYKDLPEERYFGHKDWLSKSMADKMSKAPALALQDKEPTKAMLDGRIVHKFVIEPEKAINLYYNLGPDHKGTTKAGKEHLAKVEATGLIPLKAEDFAFYRAVSDAVWANKFAREILESNPIIESSLFWYDDATKCKCKCRPDIISTEYGVVADLKTAIDASREGFAKAVYNFKYHWQAWHYLSGVKKVYPQCTRFLFIAVEKSPPYLTAVYELSELALAKGEMGMIKQMEIFNECQIKKEWPGYPEKIFVLDLPPWA